MTDKKASPTGWVVQVTVPAQPTQTATRARSGTLPGAPSFKYFNAAIADAEKAVTVTKKHSGENQVWETSVVRALSSEEIAALRLKVGEVKPA